MKCSPLLSGNCVITFSCEESYKNYFDTYVDLLETLFSITQADHLTFINSDGDVLYFPLHLFETIRDTDDRLIPYKWKSICSIKVENEVVANEVITNLEKMLSWRLLKK